MPRKRKLAYAALGLVAGLLSGMLGIGGGLVMGPALALLGIPLPIAFGTSLVAVAPVAAVGVISEWLTHPANLQVWPAIALALGGQLGVPLGSRWVVKMPERSLRLIFVAFLILAAARTSGLIGGVVEGPFYAAEGLNQMARLATSCLVGILAGISSALFGIGGGVLAVPGFLFLVGGFDFVTARATSLLAIVPTSARGAFLAGKQGRVAPGINGALLPAAALGALLGVQLANGVIDQLWLRRIFAILLVYAAVKLARRGSMPARDGRKPSGN